MIQEEFYICIPFHKLGTKGETVCNLVICVDDGSAKDWLKGMGTINRLVYVKGS